MRDMLIIMNSAFLGAVPVTEARSWDNGLIIDSRVILLLSMLNVPINIVHKNLNNRNRVQQCDTVDARKFLRISLYSLHTEDWT